MSEHTQHQFSSVQSLGCVWPFATPWTAARQASLPIANSRSLPKLMSIASVVPSSQLIPCRALAPGVTGVRFTGLFLSLRGSSHRVSSICSVFLCFLLMASGPQWPGPGEGLFSCRGLKLSRRKCFWNCLVWPDWAQLRIMCSTAIHWAHTVPGALGTFSH